MKLKTVYKDDTGIEDHCIFDGVSFLKYGLSFYQPKLCNLKFLRHVPIRSATTSFTLHD